MSPSAGSEPSALRPLPPVDTRPLFLPLHGELLALLEGLSSGDWERGTVAGRWRVRDVAAHLIDGDLRRLSLQRDGHALSLPREAMASEEGLVTFLNALNADWVRAAARLSPRILLELLRSAGKAAATFLVSLDPEGRAFLPVGWAGEAVSKNWMDVGREYTERWHHQQQIRLAVGAPLLLDPRWLRPVLELSLRALPHRYRRVEAREGESLQIEIGGASGGSYALVRGREAWQLLAGTAAEPAARIVVDEDAAWRVLFKAWPEGAPPVVGREGRPELTQAFLTAWAVMA
ncbi:MAG TPA: maleylpyruvate isomerase N-terminal domain-containing protein [Vicinamibacteria bacterium]